MIIYTRGNIFESNAYALVNPVNTLGVMGAGVALQFKKLFPHNFEMYRRACFKRDIAPGRLLFVEDQAGDDKKLIVNFPTKIHWSSPSEMSFIRTGLASLHDEIIRRKINSIAIPAIGCGLGGLEWARVKRAIDINLYDLEHVEIYVYEPKK